MRYTITALIVLILVGFGVWHFGGSGTPSETQNPDGDQNIGSGQMQEDKDAPEKAVEAVASELSIPWDIAFLPDGTMLVTEREGYVRHIESGNVIPVNGVEHVGEGGLLGIALHPNFSENKYVYLYQTRIVTDGFENRVVRYTYEDDTLSFDDEIVGGIAGAPYHDGGRIEFGPDGYLWVTAGDATVESNAQNPQTRAGSIMRFNPDGSVPEDNPYANGVYSYGHRNPQGLAWDDAGRLWSTEHGRSGSLTGMDEVNLIEAGKNYGWPEIEGDETQEDMVAPKAHSGPDVTWAPASAVYWDGSVFFGGLRGEAVYEAVLEGEDVARIHRYFHEDFGRIRSIRKGPDGMFYLTTSNRDGRGEPVESDDRIIRVDPEQAFRNIE